ncbi:major capsid protein [Alkalihalophilus marmarensis]|uniref:major capsid protein n=1 Tax=Alkalihalophilus marmarensis TaxID=521377 RepID=UPI00203C9FCD|nr:major capsid protein [Alkalihalophilus marmarensis]MCM3488786.1 major capsid protein [Alkalihalophilus marmarensis]
MTRIADIIVPEVFNPYVLNRTSKRSALVRSGIIARNPELDRLANSGGVIINMPHWNDLGGESQLLSDSEPLDVSKITAGKDMARLQMRGNAWSANELAGALAGDDPMAAIADQVSDFWIQDEQRILIAMLKGVFSSESMSGLVHDISAEETNNTFSTKGFLNAQFKLGDAYNYLTAIAVHSMTFQYMNELDLIDTEKDSDGNIINFYRGFEVIVDDSMPYSDGVYTTYLFGKGAIGHGEGGAPTPTEVDRDSLQGDDILINRRHFVLHPRGVKWTENAVEGATPSNAELATATNWSRVFDKKKIRVVQFKHQL